MPGNFETPATLQRFRCPSAPTAQYSMPYADRVDSMVSWHS